MSKTVLFAIILLTGVFACMGLAAAETTLQRLAVIGGVIIVGILVEAICLVDKWIDTQDDNADWDNWNDVR